MILDFISTTRPFIVQAGAMLGQGPGLDLHVLRLPAGSLRVLWLLPPSTDMRLGFSPKRREHV